MNFKIHYNGNNDLTEVAELQHKFQGKVDDEVLFKLIDGYRVMSRVFNNVESILSKYDDKRLEASSKDVLYCVIDDIREEFDLYDFEV